MPRPRQQLWLWRRQRVIIIFAVLAVLSVVPVALVSLLVAQSASPLLLPAWRRPDMQLTYQDPGPVPLLLPAPWPESVPKRCLWNGVCVPKHPWPPRDAETRMLGRVTPTDWPFIQPGVEVEPPYLAYPPRVRDVRWGRQLFLDTWLVDKDASQNLRIVQHKPQLVSEDLFPNITASAWPGGLVWDPWGNTALMWFQCSRTCACRVSSADGIAWSAPVPSLCMEQHLGVSDRMDTLTVVVDFRAPRASRRFTAALFVKHEPIVRRSFPGGGDGDDSRSSRRPSRSDSDGDGGDDSFEHQQQQQHYGGRGTARTPMRRLMLFQSGDGLNWIIRGSTGLVEDRSTLSLDPFQDMWTFHVKENAFHLFRMFQVFHVARATSPTTELHRQASWPDPCQGIIDWFDATQSWTRCLSTPAGSGLVNHVASDARDPVNQAWQYAQPTLRRFTKDPTALQRRVTDLYAFDTLAYESVMLGAFALWLNDTQPPKDVQTFLGSSRDGFHFKRLFDRSQSFLGPLGSQQPDADRARDFRKHTLIANGILVDRDALLIYSRAIRANQPGIDYASVAGMLQSAVVQLHTLRRDGFTSVQHAPQADQSAPCVLLTPPLRVRGPYLFLNLHLPYLSSSALITVLPAASEIPASSWTQISRLKPSKVLRGPIDRTEKLVFLDLSQMRRLVRFPILLRVVLTHGDLYSFWFSDKPDGASRGFLAAGGVNVGPVDGDDPIDEIPR